LTASVFLCPFGKATRLAKSRTTENLMLEFVWWLIVGAVAGGLARLLIPGKQPLGLLWTIVLGLLGSAVGGYISSLLYEYDPMQPGFHLAGLGMSIVGSVLLLGAYVAFSRRAGAATKLTL
jgi:uncharacterized membrane protein YeaQ/YmgE (transglycosylase-associated protein family)